jgi:hypothetical protein
MATMYDDLNKVFPNQYHFYTVTGDINEALEKCARVCAGDVHVSLYQNQAILASMHPIPSNTIDWATPVPGSPDLNPDLSIVTVVAEEAPSE